MYEPVENPHAPLGASQGTFSWLFDCFFCDRCRQSSSILVKGIRYNIQKCIGEGGFSFVYLATDNTGQKYAIKKMLIQTPEQKKEAMAEIDVMKKVKHEHVLELIAYDEVPHEKVADYSYVIAVLPFAPAGSLFDEILSLSNQKKHLEEKRMFLLFRKICEGLNALHDQKPRLAHRDIKLENVLLRGVDDPVLMDFGSVAPAKVVIKTRAEANRLFDWAEKHCTPSYRPPELYFYNDARTIKLDQRTDVWALGCLLYAMAFYRGPFDAIADQGGSVALAVSNPIVFPDNHQYSEEFESIVKWMMQTKLKERPYCNEIIDRVNSHLDSL